MSFWSRFNPPMPSQYDTEKEYEEAQRAYDFAEYLALERADEQRHEG